MTRFQKVRSQAIRLAQEDIVKTDYLTPDQSFGLVIRPNLDGVHLGEWAHGNREFIETSLIKHGAILFRGFSVSSASDFEGVVKAVAGELLAYRERAAPRTEVANGVFTSTEYPADQAILLHHEMSYSHNWPSKIWFFCETPAQQGGRTPIADDRKVFGLIDHGIKRRFVEKDVMYVRNYGEGADLRWQEVFQTECRADVEDYCRRFRTQYEWREGDRLRTRQVRQSVAVHPKTGETVWFNHAHLFHVSSLPKPVQDALLAEFAEDALPRNAFYGDGSSIESSVLDEIRDVYRQSAIAFSWQEHDVLALDNFLVSHGREPFQGRRSILVAMTELYSNPQL